MSRIFWDTMLFVYLTEGNIEFAPSGQRRAGAFVSEGRHAAYQRSCFG
jgi:hypothetical protein